MKKYALVISLVVLLLVVTPALANPHEPSGSRISLFFSGDQEFPANTAFYINHGWSQESAKYPLGLFDFELEVDGVWVNETYVERSTNVGEEGPLFDRVWVFNFPAGMSGEHTFKGHWYVPCQVALDAGTVTECPIPGFPYESKTTEVVINFQ